MQESRFEVRFAPLAADSTLILRLY
jgi:hypothetical protein